MGRTEFDTVLSAYFPNAVRHRKEHNLGWTDTVDLNVFLLRFHYYTQGMKIPRRQPGDFVLELLGVRKIIDGSEVLLWMTQASDPDEFREKLLELRSLVMGLGVAFLHVCGEVDGRTCAD